MGITLTPEQEAFVRRCLEAGGYQNATEVINAGLDLLRQQEARRQAFDKMIDETIAESDRDGWLTPEEVFAEMDDLIAEAKRQHAARNS